MTLLNTANKVRLGSALADAVYLGDDKVWPYQSFRWSLIGSWVFSAAAPVPNVTITDLANYTEIRVLAQRVAVSINGARRLRVSTDNGVTFLSTSGQYVMADVSGGPIPDNKIVVTYQAAANQCTGEAHIACWNLTAPKVVQTGAIQAFRSSYVPTTSPLNALRFDDSGGGNITAGTLWVWGR